MIRAKSLKYKTLFTILIVSTITLFISSAVLLIYSSQMMKNNLVREINLASRLTGEKLIIPLVFNDSIEGQNTLNHLNTISGIEIAYVLKKDSTVFCTYKKDASIQEPSKLLFSDDFFFADDWLYLGHPIKQNEEIIGYLNIISNNDEVTNQFKKYFWFLLLIIGTMLIISYLLALYYQGNLTRPISVLIEHANRIRNSQDYSLSIHKKGDDEFSKLYESFNHMISKIQEHNLQEFQTKEKIEKQNRELKSSFKKLEEINRELILAKSKAEESDRLKSAFLANMSHEIRTPMNGILGFTDLLLEPELSGENQKQYIEIIHKSGRRMLDTVNDIIDISKIDTGQMDVKLKEMNVHEELIDSYRFFKTEAQQKGLRFDIVFEPNQQNCQITTDVNKFKGIVDNFIKNAIKFTRDGQIILGCKEDNNHLVVYVKDTGVGVPKDRQSAIFNRFEQAELYDTRAFEGSGLGLSIAKSYAEMLNGKIWLESHINQGSCFYFAQPLQDASSTKTIDRSKSKNSLIDPPQKKMKILIAEDDEYCYEYLSIILKDVAEQIIYTKNGQSAVENYNDKIDIVLMDLKMPIMNGYQATKTILNINPKAKIIAQTAFASNEEKEKCLDSGFCNYISKPVNKKELFSIINKAILED